MKKIRKENKINNERKVNETYFLFIFELCFIENISSFIKITSPRLNRRKGEAGRLTGDKKLSGDQFSARRSRRDPCYKF